MGGIESSRLGVSSFQGEGDFREGILLTEVSLYFQSSKASHLLYTRDYPSLVRSTAILTGVRWGGGVVMLEIETKVLHMIRKHSIFELQLDLYF